MNDTWRKSTYSGGQGGDCVEVGTSSAVMVRDTKQQGQGPELTFTADAWKKFTSSIR